MDELLGQPHNLVRHPDMPEEAYRDMWSTIQSGKPWSAAVKNRRKDGDHYWVMANVTPLMQNGQPVGYMSVRTEATRETIEQSEVLYAKMRAEAQAGQR
ncbi:PAS domain-containing protein, partial [Arthrospira platensis SPKY1]|nr:PAS domain-containing protein [Arthrospira platensis SPKY1]